jgi:hypothetical protein
MEVEWRFEPVPEGMLVEIRHDLLLKWPLIGGLVADQIIGPLFVSNIAGKTLQQIKLLAEAAQAVPSLAPVLRIDGNGRGDRNG